MSDHKHKESNYYHPVTNMYYKKTDYGFKFYKGKKSHAFAKTGFIDIWHPSGMKIGFVKLDNQDLINVQEIKNEY